MEGSYYLFPCFSIRKDRKTISSFLDVHTSSGESSSSDAWTRFKDFLNKDTFSWHSICIRSCQMKVEAIHNGAENIDQNEPFKKRWEWGPSYEAILKKRITRKEDIGGNFEIPCNIGGLEKYDCLVDQGYGRDRLSPLPYRLETNC
ncbi:hypothetical protein Tco_0606352 [Tanacetum coccineum]